MNILVFNPRSSVLETTSSALRSMGHNPLPANSPGQMWRVLEQEPIDAIFLDLPKDHDQGLELLSEIKEREIPGSVIVVAEQASVGTAVEAMRRGAFDYVQRPFIPNEVKEKLARVARRQQVRRRQIDRDESTGNPVVMLESSEPDVQKAFQTAFKAAKSDATILILGASGTGKTVLARAVHERSTRAAKPFVTINCPSLSRELLASELFGHVRGSFTGAVKDTWGKVAAADGGTLFLDEIGELPTEIQPKLLRLLQDREYERIGETRTRRADVRIIAASNKDLAAQVARGRFREDLFYRLKVIAVTMPGLASRTGDLQSLAERYLRHFARENGHPEIKLSASARDAIAKHDWPGNLRELRNAIEHAVVLAAGSEIVPEDFPEEFHNGNRSPARPGHPVTIRQLEEEHIRRIVAKAESMESAASTLGIDTATLYRKRKRMGIA